MRRGCGVGIQEIRNTPLKATQARKSDPVSQNAFVGQTEAPTPKAVESVLGQSYALWKQLVAELKEQLKLDGEDWHSSGVKYGWALRLQRKGRNIVYLGPRAGSFLASFLLGDKAVAAVRNSEISSDLIQTITRTKRYGEGTPVRIQVWKPEDLQAVKILAKVKVEN